MSSVEGGALESISRMSLTRNECRRLDFGIFILVDGFVHQQRSRSMKFEMEKGEKI